jgi:hypothetical protein
MSGRGLKKFEFLTTFLESSNPPSSHDQMLRRLIEFLRVPVSISVPDTHFSNPINRLDCIIKESSESLNPWTVIEKRVCSERTPSLSNMLDISRTPDSFGELP